MQCASFPRLKNFPEIFLKIFENVAHTFNYSYSSCIKCDIFTRWQHYRRPRFESFGHFQSDPSAEFFFKFLLADKKIQLISGLAEYSRNLRNSAGIWLTNDKFD